MGFEWFTLFRSNINLTSIAGYAGGIVKDNQEDVCQTRFSEANRQGHTEVVKIEVPSIYLTEFCEMLVT